MMISGVFLLSVLTCVCSQIHEIPYMQSIEAIADVTEQLEEQLLSMEDEVPDFTDPRRHYAVLVTHLVRVADILSKSYDDTYDQVFLDEIPNSIVTGLLDLKLVIYNTNDIVERLGNGTEKLRTLIDTLCPDKKNHHVCNQITQQAVTGDPERYKEDAKMLITAGQIALNFIDRDFVEIAKVYRELPYLINNMDNLKHLVVMIADLLSQEGH